MKNNKRNLKKVIGVAIVFIFLWIFFIYLYTTYNNIDIKEENYIASRTRFHI